VELVGRSVGYGVCVHLSVVYVTGVRYESCICFQDLSVYIAQMTVFWVLMLCRIISSFHCFGGACYLDLKGY
jgi:hypothetical protein